MESIYAHTCSLCFHTVDTLIFTDDTKSYVCDCGIHRSKGKHADVQCHEDENRIW